MSLPPHTPPRLPPRLPVTADDIDRVVADFYAEIRKHPTLGPIFANHVTDWPEHEAKISRFWRNAILMERVYDGNPMMVHRAAGDVRPGMFTPWLDLFDTVLERQLPPGAALGWSSLAHRIGQSLRYGVTDVATFDDGTPRLG